MSRVARISRLARLAAIKERLSQHTLGQCIRSEQEARVRLSQLAHYEQDYQSRIRTIAASDKLDSVRYQYYQQFLKQLAVMRQQQIVVYEKAQQSTQQARHSWQHCHQKTQTMETLSDKLKKKSDHEMLRREAIAIEELINTRYKKEL